MTKISEDVMKAARDAYLAYPRKGEDEWLPTARAIMAERERCAKVAEEMLVYADTTIAADKEIVAAIRKGRKAA